MADKEEDSGIPSAESIIAQLPDVTAITEKQVAVPYPEGRIVIPRDYSHDPNITRFDETYPEALKHFHISSEQFARTISTINSFFQDAEEISTTTFLEGCFGCLTLFSLFLCYESHYKTVLRKLEDFLAKENQTVYMKNGLELLNPLYNGLLEVEFIVLSQDSRK